MTDIRAELKQKYEAAEARYHDSLLLQEEATARAKQTLQAMIKLDVAANRRADEQAVEEMKRATDVVTEARRLRDIALLEYDAA